MEKKASKDTQEKKMEMKDIHCKREKSGVSKWTKDILQLQVDNLFQFAMFEFNHYLIRLEVRIFSL